jgi:hypothetical protein
VIGVVVDKNNCGAFHQAGTLGIRLNRITRETHAKL